jgi:hypothetical protein
MFTLALLFMSKWSWLAKREQSWRWLGEGGEWEKGERRKAEIMAINSFVQTTTVSELC